MGNTKVNRQTITLLLEKAGKGSTQAAEELLPLVYEELRYLAAVRMRSERPNHTLQPTALVHEAYVRLVDDEDVEWNSRGHFFAAAAEAMRRILIDRARSRLAEKHGSGRENMELCEDMLSSHEESKNLLVLHEALTRFEEIDPDKAVLIKLRHFVGLTEVQAADALGISRATAARHWAYARAWLYDEICRIQLGNS